VHRLQKETEENRQQRQLEIDTKREAAKLAKAEAKERALERQEAKQKWDVKASERNWELRKSADLAKKKRTSARNWDPDTSEHRIETAGPTTVQCKCGTCRSKLLLCTGNQPRNSERNGTGNKIGSKVTELPARYSCMNRCTAGGKILTLTLTLCYFQIQL
jgi:hypothetical protein